MFINRTPSLFTLFVGVFYVGIWPLIIMAASAIAQQIAKKKAQSAANKGAQIGRNDALSADRYRYENITMPELERRAQEASRSGKLSAAFLRGSGLSGLWGEDELKRRETVAKVPVWDDRLSTAYGSEKPAVNGGWADWLTTGLDIAGKAVHAPAPKEGVDYRAAGAPGAAPFSPANNGVPPDWSKLNTNLGTTWTDDEPGG